MTAPKRVQTQGWRGFDADGRQQCLTCWKWQFPVIHSCPGVPQPWRTAPPAPQRIQLRRTKGWRKPESVVVVSRPSKWGNPWRAGICHRVECGPTSGWCVTDAAAVTHTRAPSQLDALHSVVALFAEANAHPNVTVGIVAALAGRDLACWCPLGQPCHGDVLLELANGGAS